MPCVNRYHLLAAFLGIALLASAPAFPQEFPARVVRVIAPLAAGGPTDGMARLVAEGLAALWAQPVIVENRPGGNMIIGTTALFQSKPDGYTMGLIGMPHIVNPSLNAQLPYRALEDFSPIVMLAHIPMVVAVYPGLGAASLADLVGIGRAKPGSLNYSATSQAGAGHLAAEMFRMKAGIDMTIVPYTGAPAAIVDLIAGRVPVMFASLDSVEPHIRAGSVKALAITTDKRAPSMPDVPTMIESGYPGFTVAAWLGLAVRAGAPEPVLAKINESVVRVLQTPEVRNRLQSQGWTVLPLGTGRQEFGQFLGREMTTWDGVIKAADIKP